MTNIVCFAIFCDNWLDFSSLRKTSCKNSDRNQKSVCDKFESRCYIHAKLGWIKVLGSNLQNIHILLKLARSQCFFHQKNDNKEWRRPKVIDDILDLLLLHRQNLSDLDTKMPKTTSNLTQSFKKGKNSLIFKNAVRKKNLAKIICRN